jgi:hypothetical protein
LHCLADSNGSGQCQSFTALNIDADGQCDSLSVIIEPLASESAAPGPLAQAGDEQTGTAG